MIDTLTRSRSRHPSVPHRRLPLSVQDQERQIQRGLYVTDGGERIAQPYDHIKRKDEWKGRKLWVRDENGTHRAGAVFHPRRSTWQKRALEFLRDNVHQGIPFHYYNLVLGHDLHVSIFADLYGAQWHSGWADPITGEVSRPFDPSFDTLFKTHYVDHICDLPACPRDLGITLKMLQDLRGFSENLGLLSSGKVTTAFVSETVSELVSATASEFADFDFHEVGTSAAAEANTQTALTTSTGIARATGTPTDSDPIYQNVGTVTADATETFEEHGLFNNSTSVAMLDRSLTGGQPVNSSDQVQYTHQLTENAEA